MPRLLAVHFFADPFLSPLTISEPLSSSWTLLNRPPGSVSIELDDLSPAAGAALPHFAKSFVESLFLNPPINRVKSSRGCPPLFTTIVGFRYLFCPPPRLSPPLLFAVGIDMRLSPFPSIFFTQSFLEHFGLPLNEFP